MSDLRVRIRQLLNVAAGADDEEARTAGMTAMKLMKEHKMVFHPRTPLLDAAGSRFRVSSEPRTLVHAVAQASSTASIITQAEAQERMAAELRAKQKRPNVPTEEQLVARMNEAARVLGKNFRATIAIVGANITTNLDRELEELQRELGLAADEIASIRRPHRARARRKVKRKAAKRAASTRRK